jgi:cell fate (sporulation/competence/biofilm development) regulator YlbF (YheA/YmcA/DUF963 family)
VIFNQQVVKDRPWGRKDFRMSCCSDTKNCSETSACSSAGGCGGGCDSQTPVDPGTSQAAQVLAQLITASPEYQDFSRLAQTVRTDPQASLLLRQIRFSQTFYSQSENSDSQEVLKAKLENLPVFQEYRTAEQNLTELCTAIDRIISQFSGLPFAANAKASACG